MKKLLFFAALGMAMASCSADSGSVKIQLPKDYKESTVVVSHIMIDNMVTAKKAEDVKMYYDTLKVSGGKAEMKLDPAGPARYSVVPPTPTGKDPDFYAAPGEKLDVKIDKFDPLVYEVTGTELMEGMGKLTSVTTPIQMEYVNLIQTNPNVTPQQVQAVMDKYNDAIKKFVAENPKSPAVPFAIMDLSADDFKAAYDAMTPEAKNSILKPFADSMNAEVEKMLAEEAAANAEKEKMAKGDVMAPAFTLPDLAGKKVSLSDFKGKWVVLDFWGSWCGWCVKGFPALKDAYAKYGDKLTIIGIDCNESEADWRAGVKKYELPWINLYNGNNRDLYTAYNISGFPTKAIISPEGKLVDLTTGEDPSFYNRLDTFLGK